MVTPFSWHNGDSIELRLIEQGNGRVSITDESGTSDYLFLSGMALEDSDDLIKKAVHVAFRHGVHFDVSSSALYVEVADDAVGSGLHKLLSAVVEVGDLIHRQKPYTVATFADEVEGFLVEHDIGVARNLEVQGRSTLHSITFYINGRHQWLAEPISATSKDAARTRSKLVAYQWLDIKNAGHQFICVAILDDRRGQVQRLWADEGLVRPIFDYSDIVFEWSRRETLPGRLFASGGQ